MSATVDKLLPLHCLFCFYFYPFIGFNLVRTIFDLFSFFPAEQMFCFFNFKKSVPSESNPPPPLLLLFPSTGKRTKKEGITSSASRNDIEVFTVSLYAVILGGG